MTVTPMVQKRVSVTWLLAPASVNLASVDIDAMYVPEDTLVTHLIANHAVNASTTGIEFWEKSEVCFYLLNCYKNSNVKLFLDNTLDIIERAGDIKKVGATGAYTKEFEDMQNQLDEAEQLLNNTDDINVEGIEQELLKLRNQINQTEYGKLKDVEELLDNTKENQISTTLKLERLNLKMIDLQTKTKELEENGTQLQEANVRGALNLIKSAKNKADAAANKAQHTLVKLIVKPPFNII